MTFGDAVNAMKNGKRVARSGWNGKGMFVFLEERAGYEPYICMRNALGKMQPGWVPSQPDILSEDWAEVS